MNRLVKARRMPDSAAETAVSGSFDTRIHTTLARDVRLGLAVVPKTLPPRYFYDDRGSALFEQICSTPEYYPTRVELALLENTADEIIGLAAPHCVIELGSGSSVKTEILLQSAMAVQPTLCYVPIDVSEAALAGAKQRLSMRFPTLQIDEICDEYETGLTRLKDDHTPRLFVFLGGTIGNFADRDAVELVAAVRRRMGAADRFVLGADRVKDPDVLHRAYNDAAGITAEFNLNVLRVINRELAADFNLDRFEHNAFYDSDLAQIEMHLVSTSSRSVTIRALDMAVDFERGESIRTEISRKFTVNTLTSLLERGGMDVIQHFEPANRYFSLVLAQPRWDRISVDRHAR